MGRARALRRVDGAVPNALASHPFGRRQRLRVVEVLDHGIPLARGIGAQPELRELQHALGGRHLIEALEVEIVDTRCRWRGGRRGRRAGQRCVDFLGGEQAVKAGVASEFRVDGLRGVALTLRDEGSRPPVAPRRVGLRRRAHRRDCAQHLAPGAAAQRRARDPRRLSVRESGEAIALARACSPFERLGGVEPARAGARELGRGVALFVVAEPGAKR